MPDKERDTEILEGAINAFKENVNLEVDIEIEALDVPVEFKNQDGLFYRNGANYLLKIIFQQTQVRFYPEIKANVTKADIALKRMLKKDPHNFLVVTRYVPAQLADQLKKNNIQFIDMAGNAFIDQLPLYIFIKGNRLPERIRPVPVKRAFRPAGLRLIYALLINNGLTNNTYREIADAAGVALGTVNIIMKELKQMNFIIDMGKRGKRLVDRELLYHKWEMAYQEQLRPKLILGRFQGPEDWWQQKPLNAEVAQWGGEVAAARLTKYLKPANATVYLDQAQLNNFLLENRLQKDPAGNTEILARFWKLPIEETNKDIVHPLLIFTDLYTTGDDRNREAANIINEQYIPGYLRED